MMMTMTKSIVHVFILSDLETPGKHVRETYTPLIPHLYIVRRGCTWVLLIFLFLVQNIDCGYSLESPRQGRSNVYPRSII